MQRIGIMAALLCFALGASAGAPEKGEAPIYRTEGPDGTPVFTDDPGHAPAERVEISEPSTYDPGDLRQPDFADEDEGSEATEGPTYAVTIDSPADEAAIRANAGNFTVNASVEPALAEGDTLELVMDGKAVATSPEGIFDLENVYRGEHSIRVRAVDSDGNVHGRSDAHTVYVLRHSIRNPS